MKIAYVFTEVPQIAGMFPNAELDEVAARGVPVELFILRNRPAQTEEARRIESLFVVHRSPYLLSLRLIGSCLGLALRRPGLFMRSLFQTIRDAASSPKILIKSVGIFPKALHYSVVARQRGITHIHAYWASLPATASSLMARFSGLSFTTWAHAGADVYNRNHQTERALRSRLHEARCVLTCNRANLDYFERLLGSSSLEKVELLTHGIDGSRFAPGLTDEKIEPPAILAVGRLSPAKGFATLLEACRLLADRGSDFRCRIAGTGKLAGDLEAQRQRLGLAERVELLGHVEHPELPKLYRESTIFVMPSIIGPGGSRDGLPNVLLEAMATELACVGSAIASITEVIEENVTGLLVPPGDAHALAHAIGRLLDDPALRERLGKQAREKVCASYGRKEAMDRLCQVFLGFHGQKGDAGSPGVRPSTGRTSGSP
jgi:glycosyltransferase involved in cell wall biosynthesis